MLAQSILYIYTHAHKRLYIFHNPNSWIPQIMRVLKISRTVFNANLFLHGLAKVWKTVSVRGTQMLMIRSCESPIAHLWLYYYHLFKFFLFFCNSELTSRTSKDKEKEIQNINKYLIILQCFYKFLLFRNIKSYALDFILRCLDVSITNRSFTNIMEPYIKVLFTCLHVRVCLKSVCNIFENYDRNLALKWSRAFKVIFTIQFSF